MNLIPPRVERIDAAAGRPAGHRTTWSLRAGEFGAPTLVRSAGRPVVQVDGSLLGSRVRFLGNVIGDGAPVVPLLDQLGDRFEVARAAVVELPVPVVALAPAIEGGTADTSVTITLFVGD